MAKKRLKRTPQWVALVPAALLIAAIGYWNIGTDKPASTLSSLDAQRTVDFYTTNSQTTQFNEQGRLHYSLTADYTEHIQQTDVTLLANPYLLLFRGTEHPWHISSERAEAGAGGEFVDLYDNVRLQYEDEKQRPFLLTTSHLHYIFAKEEAHTQADVQIETEQGITNATGMRAFAETGIVNLLSRVRGRYESK